MKKLFLFAIGATAMLASCSNEEDVQMVNDGDKVRVELNATTTPSVVATKSPVIGSSFETDTEVTVLGLAKNGTGDWTNDANHLFGNANGVTATVTKDGAVNFDGGQTYYYPTGANTSVEYTFLASYPEQPWNVTGTSATNTFTIDGKTDVLYACAEVNGGYNARYFRNEDLNPTKPTLQLNHMLTKLEFYLQKGESGDNLDDLTSAVITKIELAGIPNEMNLTVNKSEALATDDLADITEFTGSTSITLFNMEEMSEKDYDDTPALEEEVIGTSDIPFGYAIVPATTDMSKQYSVIVTIKRSDDVEGQGTTLPAITLTEDYLQGNSYKIVLKVYGYRQIKFESAEIIPWNENERPEDVIDVNN